MLPLEMVSRHPQPLAFMRLALIMGKEKVLTWLAVRGCLVIIMRWFRWGVLKEMCRQPLDGARSHGDEGVTLVKVVYYK